MKQVTYTGPVDPLDGTNQLEIDVDDKTYVLPVGVEVEVPVKVADRLGEPDLAGHSFTVTSKTAPKPKARRAPATGSSSASAPAAPTPAPVNPSGSAGDKE